MCAQRTPECDREPGGRVRGVCSLFGDFFFAQAKEKVTRSATSESSMLKAPAQI